LPTGAQILPTAPTKTSSEKFEKCQFYWVKHGERGGEALCEYFQGLKLSTQRKGSL